MSETTEVWRPIPGYDGYEASSLGRVRSWRKQGGGRRATPLILKGSPNQHGHPMISLAPSPGDPQRITQVGSAVLMAFVGPRPEGQVCRHVVNPDPKNNRPENLAWGTREEDSADCARHGNRPSVDIHETVRLHRSGLSHRAIAARLGVTQSSVSRALQRLATATP